MCNMSVSVLLLYVHVVCVPHNTGVLEDDALLESVVLLGALAGWSEGDRELAHSGLVSEREPWRCQWQL